MIRETFEKLGKGRSPVDWALQWVWNQPEVSTVLSGMSTMSQVEENLQSASVSQINSFGADEFQLIDEVREKFQERTLVPCTGCEYCMPCPNGVNIPRNFELYNSGFMYDALQGSRMAYARFMGDAERANACIQCRICEEKCPQKIPIGERMPNIHAVLGGEEPYAIEGSR